MVFILKWQYGTHLGDYLEDSGWTTALIQAGIASSGTADSFLKAAHLTRTRHGHQVCTLALSKLQCDAFLSSEALHDEENFEAWRQKMVEESPTFQFWDTVLRMEIMGLIFVRAHHEANFPLYVESLRSWFHCSLHWIITTMLVGYLYTYVIWKVFHHPFLKSFRYVGTGLFRKPIIASQLCL